MTDYKLWISGKATDGAGEISVVNPATEEVFATISRSDKGLADDAITACKAAQKVWAKTPVTERQQALNAIADGLNARAGETPRVLTMEQGKPIAESVAFWSTSKRPMDRKYSSAW